MIPIRQNFYANQNFCFFSCALKLKTRLCLLIQTTVFPHVVSAGAIRFEFIFLFEKQNPTTEEKFEVIFIRFWWF
jgi:hypothetical protein